MYIGKTIKIIRENKHIKSNILYKNILTRPAIVKFEKGLADTTVTKFLQILENLNITLEEFESIHTNISSKNLYYTNGYIDAYNTRNEIRLHSLIVEAQAEYLKTGNERYNHYYALMSLLLSELNSQTVNSNHIYIIQNYLMNSNSWGYYEVTLFTNTLSFYSNELIDLVYEKARNILISTPYKNRYRDEFAILLCNIIEFKLLNKNIESAQFYLSEFKNQELSKLDNMYTQTMFRYFAEIIEYILTYQNEDILLKIIDIFDFLNLKNEKTRYLTFYTKIKELYCIT